MQFLRLPSNAAAAACRSRQRPRASSARLPFATRRSAGLLQSGDPQWQGWTRPQPSRCLAPRQSGSSPGCCQVVREVSEGSRRPSAVSGAPPSLRNQRHGVPCLARCISPPAAIRSRRGTSAAVFRARAGFSPTDAGLLQRARLPGLPGRPGKRRIATATPNYFDAPRLPWTSGWPRRDRHRTAPTWELLYTRHQRVTTAACLAALAAKGSAPRLAPRHYRISAARCHAPSRQRDILRRFRVGSDGAFARQRRPPTRCQPIGRCPPRR